MKSLLAFTLLLATMIGCHPVETRDVSGAKVELNPPKTEEFLKTINSVQPGTRRILLREKLGDPDEVHHGSVQARPERGPAETLIDLAPAGTAYEQWVYKRGDSHYHVFLTRGTRGGDIDWEVLSVKSMPKETVY